MRARRAILHWLKRREGFRRRASKFTWMRQATPLPPAPGRSSRAPAYPKTPPPFSRRGAGDVPVLGELELAWRLLPNEFIAVTGTNGKTTTTEWIGHIHREAALPVSGGGQRRVRRLSSLVGRAGPRGDRRVRGLVVPARGHVRVRARGRGAPQPLARPPRPPPHLRGLRRRQAADLRQPGQRRHRRRAAGPRRRGPRRLRPAGDVRHRPRAPSCRRAPGRSGGTRSRCWRTDEVALPGEHNLLNAMAAAAVCLARGIDPRRRGRRAALFCRRRPPARAGRRPRRRRLDQRLQGHQRRQHAGGAARRYSPACT